MKKCIPILFLFVFFVGNSQKVIPDQDFLNQSYRYNYKYSRLNSHLSWDEQELPLGMENPNDTIGVYYDITLLSNFILPNSKEIPIDLKIKEIFQLYKEQSIINYDYYHNDDETFRGLLELLYNAGYPYDSLDTQIRYLKAAQAHFDKISSKRLQKSISRILLSRTENIILYKLKRPLERKNVTDIESEAFRLVTEKKYEPQELADFYECLGDLFESSINTYNNSINYYRKALDACRKEKGENACLQEVRILEKMFWLTDKYEEGSHSLADVKKMVFNTFDNIISLPIEFQYLFQSMQVYEFGFKGKEAEQAHRQFVFGLYKRDTCLKPLITLRYFHQYQNTLNQSSNFKERLEETFQMIEIWRNSKLRRGVNFTSYLRQIINSFIVNKEYQNARIVTKYLGKMGDKFCDPFFEQIQKCYESYILYNEGNKTRAKESGEMLLNDESTEKSVLLSIYPLMTQIAKDEKNILLFSKYLSEYNQLKKERNVTSEYVQIAQDLLNDEWKVYETGWIADRNYYAQLAYVEGQSRLKSDSIAQQNAELLQVQKLNDSLIIRSKNDSIDIANKNIELKSNQITGVALIGTVLLAILLMILVIVYNRSNTIKAKFDLESFKGIFLDHTIENAQQHAESLIEISNLKNPNPILEQASSIIHTLSLLYNEVSGEYSETSNLLDEMNLAEKYVQMACYIKEQANCTFTFDYSGINIKSIVVPKRLWLHFYINIMKHAHLLDEKNPFILTKIIMEDEKKYKVVIQNNGVCFDWQHFVNRFESKKGGIYTVYKGFNYFNKYQDEFKILFNPLHDITTFTNAIEGNFCTEIRIQILCIR